MHATLIGTGKMVKDQEGDDSPELAIAISLDEIRESVVLTIQPNLWQMSYKRTERLLNDIVEQFNKN